MRSITVTMWVTIDGVVQGLGRPDEDTRVGFTHGGWGRRYDDEVLGREMAKGMAKPGDMLFGRRTWQDFITAWGTVGRRQPGHHAHERGHQIRRLEDPGGCGCLAELDPALGASLHIPAGRQISDEPGGHSTADAGG